MFRALAWRRRAGGAAIPPLPDQPLFILPDLHGALPLLQKALARKDGDFPQHRLVILGDMLDRGADSAGVVQSLMALPEAVCLMGNHEAMLLDVLDDPARHGAAWLRHGGLETLLSFGMQGLPRGAAELVDMAADLRRRMGPAMIGWLRERPLYWQSGNVVAVHAGLDPGRALAQQSRETLLWGHPAFGKAPRRDGLFVVHGHSIVPQARISGGRLMLDTGAYASGTLSFSVMDSGRAEIYSLQE